MAVEDISNASAGKRVPEARPSQPLVSRVIVMVTSPQTV